MSKYSILFISQNNSVSRRIGTSLSTDFELLHWYITAKDLYREIPNVDCILIQVDDLIQQQYELLQDFLMIFPEYWTPVLTLGSRVHLQAFEHRVPFPIEAQIDTLRDQIDLVATVKETLENASRKKPQNVKRDVLPATIGIYSKDAQTLSRFSLIFQSLCEVREYKKEADLLSKIASASPDLLFISYENVRENDFHILERIRNYPTTKTLPIIFFGPSMTELEFKQILPFRPTGYILQESNDADVFGAVRKHLLAILQK